MRKRFSAHKKEITISPKEFVKVIKAPASKSIMQRVTALAILSEGRTLVRNPSFSGDSLSAIRLAGALGSSVQYTADRIAFERTEEVTETNINIGESGLGIRMFSPVLALFNKEFNITGTGTLLKRPISSVEDALRQAGVKSVSNNGYLPLQISGKLKGGKIEIDGSLSSQVLTGLLIALPNAEEDSEITVHKLKSKPYIDLTLQIIKDFRVKIENYNYTKFIIKGNQKYIAQDYTVEGDWSSSAFLLVAGLIAGEVKVTGLNAESKQADIEILKAIRNAGGNLSVENDCVITKKTKLSAFEFNAVDCPDLFPPLVTMAVYCKGVSRIKGVSRLKNKESDRANVLKNEFAKIGVRIEINEDEMYIHGGKVSGGTIDSHNDHRIAMAAGIVALGAESEITILNADSIKKSYSRFFRDIIKKSR
ncbi:MAG: 3-phosphoshikimate 1-carboxyvinyltransferase [Bacteroidales bacterium]|nr:3-phosphoshikimate 1-carboxyvinyltransferase [Bacteroidales bacterium]